MGKYRDAAEHLAWSLEQREALPSALQKRFEEGQRKAIPHVAKLRVSVDPPDAEVIVDTKPIGRVARVYTLFVEPGLHTVRARAPGREDAFQTLRTVAKAEHDISLHCPRAAVSSARENAPGPPSETPCALSSLAAAQTRPASPWASWPGTARIGGIVVTTATAAAGAVFLLRAHVIHGDLRERDVTRRALGWTSHTCRDANAPASCAGIRDQVNERDLFATLGTVSLATSAVFGVATAASFFTEVALFGGAPKAAGVRLVPLATSDQAGVLVEGAW
ncbi:hypothetical protein WME97_37110 [Sorangium sp. So ce367]|uniref:hypothetical protein n=1 Tax=Sorangium sp. So ce367 TaxID=3133305 RepID=UPI003F622378